MTTPARRPAPAPGRSVAGGDRHHVRAGESAVGPYVLDIGPERAGWTYCSLRVLDLPPGGSHTFDTGDSEWIVLPLSGGCTVRAEGKTFELRGRDSVFGGVSDFAYLPRDAGAQIASGAGGRFALAGAKCERRLPARYGPAPEVPVELRGAGTCSRQVNNFAAADVFACDRLIAVEVLTPGGNWSSYPPHKHDEHRPGAESVLEEIYYFEIDGRGGSDPRGASDGHGGSDGLRTGDSAADDGLAYHRVSPSRPDGTDVLAEVRTGDTVLIPDGWHGPSIAAPGRTLYYLNVMAGPGEAREWLISDHPEHRWIRTTWPDQAVDPRLPLYTADAAPLHMGDAARRQTSPAAGTPATVAGTPATGASETPTTGTTETTATAATHDGTDRGGS